MAEIKAKEWPFAWVNVCFEFNLKYHPGYLQKCIHRLAKQSKMWCFFRAKLNKSRFSMQKSHVNKLLLRLKQVAQSDLVPAQMLRRYEDQIEYLSSV